MKKMEILEIEYQKKRNFLKKFKYPISAKLKPNSFNYLHGDTNKAVRMTVKPGRWVIEHYYDIKPECKNGIYSRLYLKS